MVVVVLACCAAVAIGYLILKNATYTVRVAIPLPVKEIQILHALERDITAENRWIRFKNVPVSSLDEAAKALETGKADLTVLRSDLSIPPEAEAIAILRVQDVFLIAPETSSIDSFPDLKKRTVALLPDLVDNGPVLDRLLRFYNVDPAEVARISVPASEVGQALRKKLADAVLAVATPGRGTVSSVFAAIEKATRGTPIIVGIAEADALAAAMPVFEKGTIPKGAFAGEAPDEDVDTVTLAYRVLVPRSMPNLVAGELARILVTAKTRLAGDPVAQGIEPPDTEQTHYAIHPAARNFADGEETSWFDRFESAFWIIWMIAAIVGSALTWLWSWIRNRDTPEARVLGRLTSFLKDARKADIVGLEALQAELDEFVSEVVESHRSGQLDTDELAVYQLALSYARQALDERRLALSGHLTPSLGS